MTIKTTELSTNSSRTEMTITATQILEMLAKAQKLAMPYDIKQHNDGFEIKLYYAWCENDYYDRAVFITNENESTWNKCDFEFYTMMDMLDEKLEEKRQEKIKEQKRQELLARLTDFEKDLLGVK
jgi:hypothetical protein